MPTSKIASNRTAAAIEAAAHKKRAQTHCVRGHEYNDKNTYYVKGSGHRICRICVSERGYAKRENHRSSLLDRFMSHVEFHPGGCWLWKGSLYHGYGHFNIKGKYWLVHRASYFIFKGKDLDSLPFDHMCHDPKICKGGSDCPHRRCVNPAHLEYTTTKENSSRERAVHHARWQQAKTHCPQGHPYDDANTRITKTGGRACRACGRSKYIRKKIHRIPVPRPKNSAQIAHEFLSVNGHPSIGWGDTKLLHEIADQFGISHRGPITEKTVLDRIDRTHKGLFVKSFTSIPRPGFSRLRRFTLI